MSAASTARAGTVKATAVKTTPVEKDEPVAASKASSSAWTTVLTIGVQILALLMPFVLIAVGWSANQTVRNTSAISAINANRYTASDALSDQRRHNQEMAQLKDLIHAEMRKMTAGLHRIEQKIPDGPSPPEWFRKRVESLENEMQLIRAELQRLRKQ